MAAIAECVSEISIGDNAALVNFALEKKIGLVVVGPEVPLTNGVVDAMATHISASSRDAYISSVMRAMAVKGVCLIRPSRSVVILS